jgi:uncharacterized protein (DUF433 family)
MAAPTPPAADAGPLFELILKQVKVSGDVAALHKPGAVRLDDYPRLVYAPGQHGPGIRTEDNGTPVEDVAGAVAETPDYAALAAKFQTTPEHVAEAVRYAVAAGYATAGA